jgi:hypothetical protein
VEKKKKKSSFTSNSACGSAVGWSRFITHNPDEP